MSALLMLTLPASIASFVSASPSRSTVSTFATVSWLTPAALAISRRVSVASADFCGTLSLPATRCFAFAFAASAGLSISANLTRMASVRLRRPSWFRITQAHASD